MERCWSVCRRGLREACAKCSIERILAHAEGRQADGCDDRRPLRQHELPEDDVECAVPVSGHIVDDEASMLRRACGSDFQWNRPLVIVERRGMRPNSE
jgi:hypothetical protein